VITDGDDGSRVACSEMLRVVSLTAMMFEDGRPSGKAEEKAHSSSSTAGAGAGAGAWLLPKSKMECDGCCDCCGVDCRTGEARAAKGSCTGVCCCCLANAACCWTCCCWNKDG